MRMELTMSKEEQLQNKAMPFWMVANPVDVLKGSPASEGARMVFARSGTGPKPFGCSIYSEWPAPGLAR